MKTYAIQDVNLNHKVYNYVVKEAHELITNRPTYKKALQTEHEIGRASCRERV